MLNDTRSFSFIPVGEKGTGKSGKPHHYKGSTFHRIIPSFMIQVILKIMRMDAAEPFNAPVKPVALGIPDYFDVIKTPMDFWTIRRNLESGVKYKNLEDVYKDVQYI